MPIRDFQPHDFVDGIHAHHPPQRQENPNGRTYPFGGPGRRYGACGKPDRCKLNAATTAAVLKSRCNSRVPALVSPAFQENPARTTRSMPPVITAPRRLWPAPPAADGRQPQRAGQSNLSRSPGLGSPAPLLRAGVPPTAHRICACQEGDRWRHWTQALRPMGDQPLCISPR